MVAVVSTQKCRRLVLRSGSDQPSAHLHILLSGVIYDTSPNIPFVLLHLILPLSQEMPVLCIVLQQFCRFTQWLEINDLWHKHVVTVGTIVKQEAHLCQPHPRCGFYMYAIMAGARLLCSDWACVYRSLWSAASDKLIINFNHHTHAKAQNLCLVSTKIQSSVTRNTDLCLGFLRCSVFITLILFLVTVRGMKWFKVSIKLAVNTVFF